MTLLAAFVRVADLGNAEADDCLRCICVTEPAPPDLRAWRIGKRQRDIGTKVTLG